MKFKIGDIVKGNKSSNFRYEYTTSSCTGEVIEVYENDMFLLKILTHEHYKNEVGSEYAVDENYFDLVASNSWTGLYGTANYKKLFSIEDGVPVVSNVSKDSPCYKQLCAEYKEFLKKEKEKNA